MLCLGGLKWNVCVNLKFHKIDWIVTLSFTVVLYAVTAVYFAGVMVRLMLTLTPVVCILSAIAFSVTLDNYLVDDKPTTKSEEEEIESQRPTEEQERKNKKELYDKVSFRYKLFG